MRNNEPLKAPLSTLVDLVTEKIVINKRPDLPYVGLEHLAAGNPFLIGSAESESSTSTNNIFQRDDILFGKLRPNLRKSLRARHSGYCSTDLLVLRAREGVCAGYAAKVLQSESVFTEAVATSVGTKMPRTSWGAIRDLAVFVPPLPEQRRIAEILDTLDETILQTEQLIAKLEQVKEGLIHDLLTRGIDENGELRDPERHAEQFHEHPVLGKIPKAWQVRGLADVGASDRPFIKTGPFGSSLKGEHWVERGVAVITIGALGEGEFIEEELLHVSDATACRLAAYAVRPGDLVFSRVADVGRSVVVRSEHAGWIMSSNLMWIAVDYSVALPDFLWLNLSGSQAIRAQVRRSVNAGGREVANGTVLRSLRFPWPAMGEQREIVRTVEVCQSRWRGELALLTKLRQMRAGLMDDLLSGRVRVCGEGGA